MAGALWIALVAAGAPARAALQEDLDPAPEAEAPREPDAPEPDPQESDPQAADPRDPQATPAPTAVDPEPTPTPEARARYRFLPDREALVSSWLGGGLAERLELATSAGGRELFAVQFGGPGPLPLKERMTVFLVGGLDGISIAGSEAVLAVVDALLSAPDRLPPDATFVAVPWANPDGLARVLDGGASDGRNDRPYDDDGDGRVDEDPPDDVDEDHALLEMLVEAPDGEWVLDEGVRFLRPARAGEAPRYLRVREGEDDDGDGAFNEDPLGGVVLDRNFPVNWRGSWDGVPSGTWPLSEATTRALADLAIERRTAVWIVFQGNHGRLASPGGVAPGAGTLDLPLGGDRPTYRRLSEAFARATGRAESQVRALHEAHGGDRPGSSVDWCYAALGSLAFELGVWGPQVVTGASDAMDALYRGNGSRTETREGGLQSLGQGDPLQTLDQAWARWLDDTRGGRGFVGWQPCELGNGAGAELRPPRSVLVGGWEPFTCLNPPAELLPRAVKGLAPFVLELSHGLPRLDIEVEEQEREGLLGVLRARVRNRGSLPTGMGPTGNGLGARLRLVLPRGVRLVAGEAAYELGHLPAQGQSPVFEWLLVAPPESPFELVVESGWSPPVRKGVSL